MMKLWLLCLTIACAAGQTAPAPAKSVIGEVAAIDRPGGVLTLKKDGGEVYTVKAANSSFLRIAPGETDIKKASAIALSDIGVGDRVRARGPVSEEDKTITASTVIVMTKADIAKKHDQDRAEWQKRGLAGVVSAVNPETKELTVTPRGRDAKSVAVDASGNVRFRRYAPDSVRFSDAKPSSLAEVKTGDNIRVLGDKNEDGSRFKAEEVVSGSFETIAATVTGVDAAAGAVQLKDLQTKQAVTAHINADSVLRRLPPMVAMMMAQHMRGDAPAAAPPGAAGASPPAAAPAGTPGGPGAAGGPRGFGRGNFDLQQMIERLPALSLGELKIGDALIVSSSKGPDGSNITAITLLAGVEPFLAAAPRRAGQINLGAWADIGGIPEQ